MTTPARTFGNYEILSKIGQGGMAEVFRARVLAGPRAGWPAAIKRLLPALAMDPRYVDQFASEADLSRCLEHPNIVQVYEVGVIRDVYFIAMEYVDGRDVAQLLRRCRQRGIPVPIDFSFFLVRTLLDALAYAHGAVGPKGKPLGIVHCDVSPSNLFVSRTGDVKLGDFGVARVRSMALGEQEIAGTPFYCAPEILSGEVGPQLDLWSAAVTLYELLTLEKPFRGATPEEIFEAIRARRSVPARDLRPELTDAQASILERGLAPRPQDRFSSAAEFAQALAGVYDERIGNPLAIAAVVRGLFGAAGASES